jgi:hypothetical protein
MPLKELKSEIKPEMGKENPDENRGLFDSLN